MTSLLAPPKNDFLLTEHPVNMHEEVTQWLSELEFYKTELILFRKLLNKYFLQTSSKRKLSKYYSLELKLKTFIEKNFKQMHKAVVLHEHNLSELDKDKFLQSEKTIRNEHKKHKLGVSAFFGSVKKIKSELYGFVLQQMNEKKNITRGFEEGTLAL